jgi:hypothetical protein
MRLPAEMRKLLNRKVRQQAGICAICHEEFTDYNDIVPDHKSPKGMGGAWREDHPATNADCPSSNRLSTVFLPRRARGFQILMLKGRRHTVDLVLRQTVPRGFVSPL